MNTNEHLREHLRLVGALSERLDLLPAEVRAPEYTPDAFGSWSLTVRRGRLRFAIVFDGKDRALVVHRGPGGGGREVNPTPAVAERSLPGGLTTESLDGVVSFIEKATAG